MTGDGGVQATRVDLSGLLDLLGSHLYSTPAVAVRELVQNAQDSITRRRLLDPDWNGGTITVECDPDAHRLTVSDDGIGMTDAEVVEQLATIGVGGTRAARAATGSADLIGLFGVGFLSAFSVSDRVVVRTTPVSAPATGWEYRSQDGHRYSMRPVPSRPAPGSTVILDLRAEHSDLADPVVIRSVLELYCALLRTPVLIVGDDRPVNVDAPWRQTGDVVEHPVVARRARMAFAAQMSTSFDPVWAFEVPPAQGTDARGVLWIHDGATYGTSDHRDLRVYVRGMLVADDARDLLPRWAGFVSGVLESDVLAPTASRESLQEDARYFATALALREAVVTGLQAAARDEPEAWRRIVRRHDQALRGAALVDDRLFALLGDVLRLPTSDGELTAAEIARAGRGRIHVSGGRGGFEEMLFRTLGVPIADGGQYGVLPFLQRWGAARAVEIVEIGSDRDASVFRPVPLAAPAARLLDETFGRAGLLVVGGRFEPAELPFVVVPDRGAALKAALESDDGGQAHGRGGPAPRPSAHRDDRGGAAGEAVREPREPCDHRAPRSAPGDRRDRAAASAAVAAHDPRCDLRRSPRRERPARCTGRPDPGRDDHLGGGLTWTSGPGSTDVRTSCSSRVTTGSRSSSTCCPKRS